MRNKFKNNKNYYIINYEQMLYVVIRLDDKTFTQYRIRNKINLKLFEKFENIIKLIIKFFENLNHKRIVKRNFKNFIISFYVFSINSTFQKTILLTNF